MFDPVQLRSFVAVAETGSFTAAAGQLHISQPTVSQHVRRLEKAARGVLLNRDARAVRLTDNGDAMLRFAREILTALDAAAAYFDRSAMRGRLRFGVADDLATTELPAILREFRRRHPGLNLSLTVGQSDVLARRLRAGHLDLAYVKQEPGLPDGRFVRRTRYVWVAHRALTLPPAATVPLIAYPAPSLSRSSALRALEQNGRTWQISCSVRDLDGALAATRAGIGIAVLPLGTVPTDLADVGAALDLPVLGEVDFALLANPRSDGDPVQALIHAILRPIPGTVTERR